MRFFHLFLFVLLAYTCFSCGQKERYGAKLRYNQDTEKFTPLNREACYYLAYESLAKHQPEEARQYLSKMKDFPETIEKSAIMNEGEKTILSLSYLEEKNYSKALESMQQLKDVSALPPDPYANSMKSYYNQIGRIRSASIQLRNSLPALQEFLELQKKSTLTQSKYLKLKNKWHVTLSFQYLRSISQNPYPFPEYVSSK